jgi:penicillin V acylase-like amidase (Ntn superfamily)
MNYWKTTLNGTNYSITINGRFVEFTKDGGTAESFGGNNMPIERFFRSQKWQQHVENTYGEKILSEVLLAAESCKMVSKPVGWAEKPNAIQIFIQ